MFKISVDLSAEQITQAIDHLPQRDKIQLIEKLEKETIRLRWKQILKDIDARLKRFPLSQKDVLEEIHAYRKTKHAQSRH